MLQNAGMETCVGEYTKMRIAPNMRVCKLNTVQRLFLQNAADERLIFAGSGYNHARKKRHVCPSRWIAANLHYTSCLGNVSEGPVCLRHSKAGTCQWTSHCMCQVGRSQWKFVENFRLKCQVPCSIEIGAHFACWWICIEQTCDLSIWKYHEIPIPKYFEMPFSQMFSTISLILARISSMNLHLSPPSISFQRWLLRAQEWIVLLFFRDLPLPPGNSSAQPSKRPKASLELFGNLRWP